jgi:hypothetical protein
MAKKGRSAPGIGAHGSSSMGLSDVSSTLSEPHSIASRFKPDASDIPEPGPSVFKFPLDDVSAGNFWTRLIINSWIPVKRDPGANTTESRNSSLDKDSIANIWLPMPLTLQTTYNQRYTASDNIMVNRGSENSSVAGYTGPGAEGFAQASAAAGGAASEFADFVSSMANINNSGKMAMGSIQNQMMGLVYDGASLRSHSLNWRMIPQNREEQFAIETVCFAFKKFSSPVVKGIFGADINVTSSHKAHKMSVVEIDKTKESGVRYDKMSAASEDGAGDMMRTIGRLGIPVTVNVEFWYGDKVNPHLFQIKDSFIESVEVIYTPTGTWNAYEDGAPIETQLNVVLKENAIVTQDDIKHVGGY